MVPEPPRLLPCPDTHPTSPGATSETSVSRKGWAGRDQDCSMEPFGSSGACCMGAACTVAAAYDSSHWWHRGTRSACQGTAGGEEVQADHPWSPLRSKYILTTVPPLTSHRQRQDNPCAAVPQHRTMWGPPCPGSLSPGEEEALVYLLAPHKAI